MMFTLSRSRSRRAAVVACCLLAVARPGVGRVRAEDPPTPETAADAEATAADADDATKKNKPLSIPIPLPIGDTATEVKIPQYGEVGQLLSQLKALSVKRLDPRHLEFQQLVIDLNKPDGKTDFRINLPASVFDTETQLIHSEQPVTISTADFELQGERMEFDTQARSGKLRGWVYMKIHNVKDVAAVKGKDAPKTDDAGGGEQRPAVKE